MGDAESKTRIGGWLAVFILVLGVVSPALTLFRTMIETLDYSWATMPVWGTKLGWVLWAIGVGNAAASAALALLLLTIRHPAVRWITAGSLWLIATADILCRALAVDAIYGAALLTSLRHPSLGQLRPFVFCAVWTAYLLRSKRVARTYRREPIRAPLEEVFR